MTYNRQPMPIKLYSNTQELFEMKVNKDVSPNSPNGCWTWTAGKNKSGYGMMTINNMRLYAHRVSYTLYKGPIPEGLLVCHLCNNRSCVNPEHLEIGTHWDNKQDSIKAGTDYWKLGHQYTPPARQTKLSDKEVIEIRHHLEESVVINHRLVSGLSYRQIARMFNVTIATISHIKNNEGRFSRIISK